MREITFVLGMYKNNIPSLKSKKYANSVSALNEQILRENTALWSMHRFEVEKLEGQNREFYVKKAEKILKKRLKESKKITIADPRCSILFPLWEEAAQELDVDIKVIVAYENPVEIAKSVEDNSLHSFDSTLVEWCKYFLNMEMFSRGHNRTFVSTDRFFDKKSRIDAELQKTLELGKRDFERVRECFAYTSSKHNKELDIKTFTNDVASFLQKTLTMIREGKGDLSLIDTMKDEFLSSINSFVAHEPKAIEFTEQKAQTLEQNANALKEQLAQKDNAIAELNTQKAQTERKAQTLEAEVDEFLEDIATLKEKNAQLLREQSSTKDEDAQTMQKLREHLVKAKLKAEDLGEEIEQKEQTNKKLEEELEKLKKPKKSPRTRRTTKTVKKTT